MNFMMENLLVRLRFRNFQNLTTPTGIEIRNILVTGDFEKRAGMLSSRCKAWRTSVMGLEVRGRPEPPGGVQGRSPGSSRVLSYFNSQNSLKMVFSFFFFLIFVPLLSANLLAMHIFNAWWDNFRHGFCAKRRNLCCAAYDDMLSLVSLSKSEESQDAACLLSAIFVWCTSFVCIGLAGDSHYCTNDDWHTSVDKIVMKLLKWYSADSNA